MSIEGIRERQRLSVLRAAADQIIYDHCEQPMQIENQKRISDAYPDLFDASVARLHDGWTEIIMAFFRDFHGLGDGTMSPGEIRFEREVTGIKAFCWPNPQMQWPEGKAQALLEMQHKLHLSSQSTCEWCGKPASATKLGDRVTIYLCEEDAASAREKLSAKVAAFDERVKFRGEIGILFQEHANVWLHVGEINAPILRKALLDIKNRRGTWSGRESIRDQNYGIRRPALHLCTLRSGRSGKSIRNPRHHQKRRVAVGSGQSGSEQGGPR